MTSDNESQRLALARKYVWWTPPESSLQEPKHLIAQIMNLATWEDAMTALALFGEGAFKEVLKSPPPGLLSDKSWHFWHAYLQVPMATLTPPTRKIA